MPTERGISISVGSKITDHFPHGISGFEDSPNKEHLKAGQYTDDTQLTIILAETLLEKNGEFDEKLFLKKVFDLVREKKMRSIGPSLLNIVQRIARYGIEKVLSEKKSSQYPSNGAAMRTAPLALLHHRNHPELHKMSYRVSSLTHGHPLAIGAACAMSFLLALIIKNGNTMNGSMLKKALHEYLTPICPELAEMMDRSKVADGSACSVEDTLPEVMDSFFKNPSDFRAGVLKEANSEGDTDTKASMIGQLLGAYNGVSAIPPEFVDGLEKDGRDYLIFLADRLLDLSCRLRNPTA